MNVDRLVAAALHFGRGAAGDAVLAWRGNDAYVLSHDKVICLHSSKLPHRETAVCFRVCDYETPDVQQRGNQVIFSVRQGNEMAEVTVPAPPESFAGLAGLFARFKAGVVGRPGVMLSNGLLRLLADDLPHVEFLWDDNQCRIVQKNVYTGKTLLIRKMPQRAGEGKPLALRTADLFALFSLANAFLLTHCGDYFFLTDFRGLEAIVGGCLYDDLGDLNILSEV